jgi:hypothetical protein
MERFQRVFMTGNGSSHPQAHEIDEESKVEAPVPYTGDKHIAVLKWLDKVLEWGVPCQPVCHAS